MNAILTRQESGDRQTLGQLSLIDDWNCEVFTCKTLELPWLNNKFRISCITKGEYTVEKRYSEKYGHHFHVKDVEGRTYILIHAGNYYGDTLGCILVGDALTDINGDGIRDVTNSRDTLDKLLDRLPDEFTLTIKEAA